MPEPSVPPITGKNNPSSKAMWVHKKKRTSEDRLGYDSAGEEHRVSNRQWLVLQGHKGIGSTVRAGGDQIKTDIQEESKGEVSEEESFIKERKEAGSTTGAEKTKDIFGSNNPRHK